MRFIYLANDTPHYREVNLYAVKHYYYREATAMRFIYLANDTPHYREVNLYAVKLSRPHLP